ncbi:alpha/beta hydrolase family protein [Caulobacter sp. UC70_42]|uniref:alpha/beta hydrolase family protein n=1 Tax=Caulobacter sp. UC70_42 TaxID=3374551 RepID=UPI0037568CB1
MGESLGALSPDGRRLIVYRLVDHTNELGVADLSTGAVRWLGRGVELEWAASLARWRNNDEVVALTTTPQTPSMWLNKIWQTQARTTSAWAAAQAGEPSVTVLAGGPGASQNPAWPDVDLIAFDVSTGAQRVLARGPFMELAIAPGGGTASVISAQEPVAMDPASLAQNGLFDRRRRLVLVNLITGRTITGCAHCDMASTLMSWAPDGRAVLITARPDEAKSGDWRDIRYWRVDLDGRSTKLSTDLAPATLNVVGGTTPTLQADAGWVDGAPAVLAQHDQEEQVKWWRVGAQIQPLTGALKVEGARRVAPSPGGFLVRTKDGLLRLGNGPTRPVVDPSHRIVTPPALSGDLPQGLQIETARGVRTLSATGLWGPSSATPSGATLLALSRDGASLVLSKTPQGVATLSLLRDGLAARALMTVNPALAAVDLQPPRPIVHRTPRGEQVTSWLYTPANHGPGDDRAVIVVPYPGSNYLAPPSSASGDGRAFTTNIRLMVAAGYAVLVPSMPIPADAAPQVGMADAMLTAVDAALAADPGLSKTRLAVWGHSYGGYGALVAATQSPRFKAVIASSGATNLFSYWGSQGPAAIAVPETQFLPSTMFGWSETGQARLAGPPWQQVQRYVDASPLLQADRITAPVLLIQGDFDYDPEKSMGMFAALYRQGKPVELLTYKGEGHVVQSPGNVRDVYRRSFSFLQAALSAATPLTAPMSEATASRPSQ